MNTSCVVLLHCSLDKLISVCNCRSWVEICSETMFTNTATRKIFIFEFCFWRCQLNQVPWLLLTVLFWTWGTTHRTVLLKTRFLSLAVAMMFGNLEEKKGLCAQKVNICPCTCMFHNVHSVKCRFTDNCTDICINCIKENMLLNKSVEKPQISTKCFIPSWCYKRWVITK